MKDRSSRSRPLAAALILVSISTYAPSWRNYFVCDDYEFLGRVTLRNAHEYFFRPWAYGHEYRPLVPYSYALDAAISGEDQTGYHVTSTILHTANSWMLMEVATVIRLAWPIASLASFIFLLNPVSHEAVLWISGRPVLLSTFFQLLSILCFVHPDIRSRFTRRGLCCLFFCLALLTYEAAVAHPVALALLVWSGRTDRQWSDLVPVAAILLIYLVGWLAFFHFHAVRWTETSAIHAFTDLLIGVSHGFHGSYRVGAAMLYASLMIWFGRNRRGRATIALSLAFFAVLYAPFFASRGFADRFDYAPSFAIALLLASAIVALSERSVATAVVAAIVLLAFYEIGVRDRVRQWRESGEIARRIPLEIFARLPDAPEGTVMAIAGVPAMHKHAYLFLTGLERAVPHVYMRNITVIRCEPANCTYRPDVCFRYEAAGIVEVPCR